MTTAILCPGPSLAELPAELKVDRVIGVNRAVLKYPCTWWAALDWQVVDEVGPACDALLTMRASAESLARRQKLPEHVVESESLFEYLPPPATGWTRYSMTTAIVFAASLGSTLIELYGFDATNATDWDGGIANAAGLNRTGDRWAAELATVAGLSRILNERGVTLVNHGRALKH